MITKGLTPQPSGGRATWYQQIWKALGQCISIPNLVQIGQTVFKISKMSKCLWTTEDRRRQTSMMAISRWNYELENCQFYRILRFWWTSNPFLWSWSHENTRVLPAGPPDSGELYLSLSNFMCTNEKPKLYYIIILYNYKIKTIITQGCNRLQ